MTDNPNDRFDDVLDDALRAYNRPPNERQIAFDDMWRSIEAEAFPGARRSRSHVQWLRIAAALVIGVGIGRFSFAFGSRRAAGNPPNGSATRVAIVQPSAAPLSADALSQPVDLATSRYLGQAAALLIALPAETNGARPDQSFMKRANELLLTTRLLIDSQSGADPAMRNLLEDLELVLVQVVRLEKEREPSRRTEMELIQQALEQRDVIPRLRTAASEYAADD
jgi:hypothetical protein